jgi:lysozyme
MIHEFLEELEGRRKLVYQCTGGHPTIGVGHKLTKDELSGGNIRIGGMDVPYSNGLTEAQIDDLAAQDTLEAVSAIDRLVTVPLSVNQKAALIAFVFNVGVTAFSTSTLLRLLNGRNYKAVPGQLKRWNKVRNPKTGQLEVSQGLIDRRAKEIKMWEAV